MANTDKSKSTLSPTDEKRTSMWQNRASSDTATSVSMRWAYSGWIPIRLHAGTRFLISNATFAICWIHLNEVFKGLRRSVLYQLDLISGFNFVLDIQKLWQSSSWSETERNWRKRTKVHLGVVSFWMGVAPSFDKDDPVDFVQADRHWLDSGIDSTFPQLRPAVCGT